MKLVRPEDDGPTDLFRLLEEVRRCLECTDLAGANAALKRPTPRPYPWAAWHQGIRDTERIRRSGESLMKERA